MTTRKIKLAYPTYKFNRLKNVIRNNPVANAIGTLISFQNDKVNNYGISMVRDDVLNPGPWTLHFDGKDFWFEAEEETILNTQLNYEEATE
jgi:hypothetical protein